MGTEMITVLMLGVLLGLIVSAFGVWTLISSYKAKAEMGAGFAQMQQQVGQALQKQQETINELRNAQGSFAPVSVIENMQKALTELMQKMAR